MKLIEAIQFVSDKFKIAQEAGTSDARFYAELEVFDFLRYGNIDGFEFIGKGRHRATFARPDSKYVLKIPHCLSGCDANISEAKFYAERHGHAQGRDRMARCRLVMILDIPCVLMERIIRENYNYPDWANYVDCQQVGYNRKGHIVAYDYADARP